MMLAPLSEFLSHVIASEAKQSRRVCSKARDCFTARRFVRNDVTGSVRSGVITTGCIAVILLLSQCAWADVIPGIDYLLISHSALVAGKRIAVVTNHTGYTRDGRRTVDAISSIKGVKLVSIFTPEHGLTGAVTAGSSVVSTVDSATGVPVISLYGALRKPKKEMLAGIDAIVYDIQDIGIRSYTFISTMGLVMQAAGEANVEVIVLDRPGLLADRIDGTMLDTSYRSFVGKYPIPYVYGMTAGELAKMINEQGWMLPRCRLTVVPMLGWVRSMPWYATGLQWRPTSPNIPEPATAMYCAAFGAMGELGAGYQGIGTKDAFRVFGGSKIPARSVDSAFRALHLSGVHTIVGDTIITTKSGASMPISYIRFVIDRDSVDDLFRVGLHLLAILHRMKLLKPPDSAHIAMFNKVCGGNLYTRIISDEDVNLIVPSRSASPKEFTVFMTLRDKYLLYP